MRSARAAERATLLLSRYSVYFTRFTGTKAQILAQLLRSGAGHAAIEQVLSLLYSLYWYKSADTGAAIAQGCVCLPDSAHAPARAWRRRRRQFTCFTSTKVQILTPEELQGYYLISRMRERGVASDVVVFNTLIDAYAKAAWAGCGQGIGPALQVLELTYAGVCWRMLTYADVC